MRVDILANDRASFIRPMAEGLARMLASLDADARVHLDGLAHLMRALSIDFSTARSLVGSSTKLMSNRRDFDAFVESLRGTDVIVVVANVPGSFSRSLYPNIEVLRERLPDVPIVNYDLHYLPTLYSWSKAILRDEETKLSPEHLEVLRKGKFGLERYDWYLMASVATEIPLPPGEHPYSLIGLNLDDGSLFPEQHGEFIALLDFDSTSYFARERAVQLEAVRKSGVKWQKLEGQYTRADILSIYRKAGAFLMSRSEAFGLSIVEAQACGAKVFLPDPYWAASHWRGENYHDKRAPSLTANFVLYENDVESLTSALKHAAESFDPAVVRETLIREQSQLYYGDSIALKKFLSMVESGKINCNLHREHSSIGR